MGLLVSVCARFNYGFMYHVICIHVHIRILNIDIYIETCDNRQTHLREKQHVSFFNIAVH